MVEGVEASEASGLGCRIAKKCQRRPKCCSKPTCETKPFCVSNLNEVQGSCTS